MRQRGWPKIMWDVAAGTIEVEHDGGWRTAWWAVDGTAPLSGPVAPVRFRARSRLGIPSRATTQALRDGDVVELRLSWVPGRIRVATVERTW